MDCTGRWIENTVYSVEMVFCGDQRARRTGPTTAMASSRPMRSRDVDRMTTTKRGSLPVEKAYQQKKS